MIDIKTYIELKIKNSKGLLSELKEKYQEYLKKNTTDNEERPIEKHLDRIKKEINFSFHKKKGNILDINV